MTFHDLAKDGASAALQRRFSEKVFYVAGRRGLLLMSRVAPLGPPLLQHTAFALASFVAG